MEDNTIKNENDGDRHLFWSGFKEPDDISFRYQQFIGKTFMVQGMFNRIPRKLRIVSAYGNAKRKSKRDAFRCEIVETVKYIVHGKEVCFNAGQRENFFVNDVIINGKLRTSILNVLTA